MGNSKPSVSARWMLIVVLAICVVVDAVFLALYRGPLARWWSAGLFAAIFLAWTTFGPRVLPIRRDLNLGWLNALETMPFAVRLRRVGTWTVIFVVFEVAMSLGHWQLVGVGALAIAVLLVDVLVDRLSPPVIDAPKSDPAPAADSD